MYLKDLVESEWDWTAYEALLGTWASFLEDCVRHLFRAHAIVDESAAKDGKYCHATVTMLIRHVCEFVDGISVLTARGCAEPCKPLLRSAWEADLGIHYILKADLEKRALAYQVAHAHSRIKLYRKMKENEQAGREFRELLASDPIYGQVALPQKDWQSGIEAMERLLARAEYAPIEEQWQTTKRRKKGGDPKWFQLFDGPCSVRQLALHLKQVFCYEFLYRQWSTAVHAGGCLENVAADEKGNMVVRPIRHPDGLQAMVSFAGTMSVQLASLLVEHYAPEQLGAFRESYIANLRQRHLDVSGKSDLIRAPWK